MRAHSRLYTAALDEIGVRRATLHTKLRGAYWRHGLQLGPFDYGEGKTRDQEALDSAMMLGVVMLLASATLIGIGIGFVLGWWLT